MLKKMVGAQPKDWNQYIKPLLFAYRETPGQSLAGFSPFEVLYGRPVLCQIKVKVELANWNFISSYQATAHSFAQHSPFKSISILR